MAISNGFDEALVVPALTARKGWEQPTLASFSPATGSTFALLPPDNASGNFVKVVQRLPVKIVFTDVNDSLVHKLRPGMNVFADVHLD